MSLTKSVRLALKYMRRFIAGFASTTTFSFSKIKKYPFAEYPFALEQDRLEIASDRDLAAFKQKQNDRKQQ